MLKGSETVEPIVVQSRAQAFVDLRIGNGRRGPGLGRGDVVKMTQDICDLDRWVDEWKIRAGIEGERKEEIKTGWDLVRSMSIRQ